MKKRGSRLEFWFAAMACWGAAVATPPALQAQPKGTDAEFKSLVKPVIAKYCVGCHEGADAPAGIDLAALSGRNEVQKDPGKWLRAAQAVNSGRMPPKGSPEPSLAERKAVFAWFDSASIPDCRVALPGRVTVRRLNRSEYTRTVRDLLGVRTDAAEGFPSDDVGYGFDNIGDVLSVSALNAEKYLAGAEKIARQAIVAPDPVSRRYSLDGLTLPPGANADSEGGVTFATVGALAVPVQAGQAGRYRLKLSVTADQAGPEQARVEVMVNGQSLGVFTVQAERPARQVITLPASLPAGRSVVKVSFPNDFYEPANPNPRRRDRNLVVDWVELDGPVELQGVLPDSHLALLGATPPKDPVAHASDVLGQLASKAYRRPAKPEEVARLSKLYTSLRAKGFGNEKAMQTAVVAILCNPHFLYRVERPRPDGALSGFEVASRLSYFLWGTMPDSELTTAAAVGKLGAVAGVRAQVTRMLASDRADALAEEFAAQWLQLRKLEATDSDSTTYPEATKSLRSAMAKEAKLMFMAIVRADRPVTELLTTPDTHVNGELARLYGLAGVAGKEFVKVRHTDPNRGGLTGLAAFLTVTSNPNRTSPVKRGKFILEELLGTPPPPPPPNVGVLVDGSSAFSEKPMKQRLAEHRSNPACANCHKQMDMLGFCLEGFDGIGKARAMDGRFPVDDTGEGEDGKPIKGVPGLRSVLASRQDQFARAFVQKLMTFALGRGLDQADRCHVDAALEESKKEGYRFSAVVKAIVSTPPFTRQDPPRP